MKKIVAKGIPRPLDKYGYCNICSEWKELTEDHVPPKGCVGTSARQASRLIEYLKIGALSKRNAKIMQNGIRFKSICSDCNNRLLGSHYDPALKDLAKQVSAIANLKNRNFSLPPKLSIKIKPLPLLKAVAGHLLAARVRSNMQKTLPDAPAIKLMQEFVLDVDKLPNEYLKFYCWLYPSDIQVIVLGLGLIDNFFSKQKNFIVCDIIKFFPIGFLVSFDSGVLLPTNLHLTQITMPPTISLDDEIELQLFTGGIPRIDWPEYQEDDSVMLLNDELAYFAQKYKRKK